MRSAFFCDSHRGRDDAPARINPHDRAVLERRLAHLEERIEKARGEGRDLSYDRSELAALRRLLR